MKRSWEKFANKLDSLSLRERVLIFSAVAFILVSLVKAFFLEPLLVQQKKLTSNMTQQQQRMKELQAQIDVSMKAKKELETSAQHQRLEQARKQLEEGNAYLQQRSDRLVPPESMAELLEQVLNHNGRLQLVSLETMPVAPLNVKASSGQGAEGSPPQGDDAVPDRQVFKHGVVLTMRGSYLDLMHYLDELEKLPMQMFWGKAEMKVVRYPVVELSLTVYTLSLEKTWLQI